MTKKGKVQKLFQKYVTETRFARYRMRFFSVTFQQRAHAFIFQVKGFVKLFRIFTPLIRVISLEGTII